MLLLYIGLVMISIGLILICNHLMELYVKNDSLLKWIKFRRGGIADTLKKDLNQLSVKDKVLQPYHDLVNKSKSKDSGLYFNSEIYDMASRVYLVMMSEDGYHKEILDFVESDIMEREEHKKEDDRRKLERDISLIFNHAINENQGKKNHIIIHFKFESINLEFNVYIDLWDITTLDFQTHRNGSIDLWDITTLDFQTHRNGSQVEVEIIEGYNRSISKQSFYVDKMSIDYDLTNKFIKVMKDNTGLPDRELNKLLSEVSVPTPMEDVCINSNQVYPNPMYNVDVVDEGNKLLSAYKDLMMPEREGLEDATWLLNDKYLNKIRADNEIYEWVNENERKINKDEVIKHETVKMLG